MTWPVASRSTVTGTCSPASVKIRVIPTFCAITPERIGFILCCCSSAPYLPVQAGEGRKARVLELDLDIDACRKIELHQRIDRLGRRIDDVEQPLVGSHLKLLAALLVDVRRAVHGEFFDLGRQRDRPAHLRAGALGGCDDLARGRIEDAVIERLEPDSNVLAVHGVAEDRRRTTDDGLGRAFRLHLPESSSFPLSSVLVVRHSMMLVTTPEPTVRPPSRMAKRSFSSMAIGTINSIVMAMLSPGITISVPSGRCTTPVTSVVRK